MQTGESVFIFLCREFPYLICARGFMEEATLEFPDCSHINVSLCSKKRNTTFCLILLFMPIWKACDLRESRKLRLKSETKGENEKNMQMKSKHIKIILIKSQCMWLCVIHDAQKSLWELIKYLILTFTRKILIDNRNRRQNDFPK